MSSRNTNTQDRQESSQDERSTTTPAAGEADAILQVTDLHTYYGKSHVLQGVSLQVNRGEFVCLVGRNGAGKTTTLKSIMGLVPPREGTVKFEGEEIQGESPDVVANQGIGYVPGERNVFPDLTVHENLLTGTFKDDTREIPDRVFELFPILEERSDQKAGTLSGGQQQMLVMGRALVGDPSLLLIDEPFEGIQPSIVTELTESLRKINAEGTSILMVEQNAREALELAQRAYIIQNGQMTNSGPSDEIWEDDEVQETYFSM